MRKSIENGTVRDVKGKRCVYYDGYWIRHYPRPEESLAARKSLIDGLTRRTFHHTEAGLNTPGEKLDMAREAYESESDPARKRVKGAMLAGALFNRTTDIFTTVVDLAQKGVNLSFDNELMKLCSDYLTEAMELGKMVKHYSGHEGIDELWGEPLKAFTMSFEEFYTSRYIKIAQTMRDIDRIADTMVRLVEHLAPFNGIAPLIREFAEAAKLESETMKSDSANFDVWPAFVAAGERLIDFAPVSPGGATDAFSRYIRDGARLIHDGKDLLTYIASARVPMPKSTVSYLASCDEYSESARLLREAS